MTPGSLHRQENAKVTRTLRENVLMQENGSLPVTGLLQRIPISMIMCGMNGRLKAEPHICCKSMQLQSAVASGGSLKSEQ